MEHDRPIHGMLGPRKDLYGAPERRPSAASTARFAAAMIEHMRRRKRRGDGDAAVPVGPDRPSLLSGGAAAGIEE